MRALPTADAAARAGLSARDYREVCARLGREPNPIEARMFGVMWSEHCGYKHSKKVLQRLPSWSPRVLSGPGENAGAVDVGGGWAIAFKMESHNHPSAVDPYNGAATGIGGIIRDVLAMGARPVALLDSLRFGPLDEPRARRLCNGVVAGIAGYGNALGVPTVGGELLADDCYRDNPLVNVACLGLVRADRVATSAASGPGNAVLYVGARTGRDGIGGAAFASIELDEQRESEDRASVQMGDPFTGKLLIEATLEALATGAVVALQDMGAAGLTCAASEMAARGGVGMTVDLDRVPLRERGMRPDEILLSESQERMLLVVGQRDADRVAAIYRRWGLAAAVIGTVTAEPRLIVTAHGRPVVDLPPDALARAPAYDPAAEAPKRLQAAWTLEAGSLPQVAVTEALRRMLTHPDVATKRRIFEQYDHMVGVRTVVTPGADAAVLRLIEVPPLGIALSVDGNARWCALDPRRGAALAVLEAAANLACVGAEPVAVTDCLNFGNPERPTIFWAFREAVCGIAEACDALGVPVISGNVSFYNEAEGSGGDRAVWPTPVIGMAGLVPDVSRLPAVGFVRDGDLVVIIGGTAPALGSSLYVRCLARTLRGRPADPQVPATTRAIRLIREAVRDGVVRSAHDVSDGGLAVALAEACILGGRGAAVILPLDAGTLFGEGPGRFVVSVDPSAIGTLEALARAREVPLAVVGRAGGRALRMVAPPGDPQAPALPDDREQVEMPLDAMIAAYDSLEV
ncbi:MAG: phosphoribosylformylglycinamidine synthase subunit PurL [Armatimonadota bacterium]|nr:phosphoribosylformylglycinamidine synthase subunit PurL [Armatimonadota bacterium]